MGEGASRLQTGLQAFKWEPVGGRGLEVGPQKLGGEKMAREAAFLRDLGWATGGGRTGPGGLPLRRQELRPGSGLGWGDGTKGPSGLGLGEKKTLLSWPFWELPQQSYIEESYSPPRRVGHLSGSEQHFFVCPFGVSLINNIINNSYLHSILEFTKYFFTTTLPYESKTRG